MNRIGHHHDRAGLAGHDLTGRLEQLDQRADVDEDVKESRFQWLKDQLAATESEEGAELRQEIKDLTDRIEELTRTGAEADD